MRFLYAYKTSDGVRHEDRIDAQSREEAFSMLRAKGIRPIKVMAADGSKANGEVRGLRKNAVIVIVAFSTIIAASTAYVIGRMSETNVNIGQKKSVRYATARPRHWIGGNVKASFAHPSENILSLFAQPGVLIDEGRLPKITKELNDDLFDAIENEITIDPQDDIKTIDLKRVVAYLKQEAIVHLKGGTDLSSFITFLLQRQKMEAGLRNQLLLDIKNAPESEKRHFLKLAEDMISTMGLEPIGEIK